jgi:hypothetical protein
LTHRNETGPEAPTPRDVAEGAYAPDRIWGVARPMPYVALATDYDGTIAQDGTVSAVARGPSAPESGRARCRSDDGRRPAGPMRITIIGWRG